MVYMVKLMNYETLYLNTVLMLYLSMRQKLISIQPILKFVLQVMNYFGKTDLSMAAVLPCM